MYQSLHPHRTRTVKTQLHLTVAHTTGCYHSLSKTSLGNLTKTFSEVVYITFFFFLNQSSVSGKSYAAFLHTCIILQIYLFSLSYIRNHQDLFHISGKVVLVGFKCSSPVYPLSFRHPLYSSCSILYTRGGRNVTCKPHATLWPKMFSLWKYIDWAYFYITVNCEKVDETFKHYNYVVGINWESTGLKCKLHGQ